MASAWKAPVSALACALLCAVASTAARAQAPTAPPAQASSAASINAPTAPLTSAPRAEVIHWWTSGGESAAVRQLAEAYRRAGGVWVDSAIAGNEQARAVATSRIIGGNPPTAAMFNTTKQFLDIVEEGLLNNVDAVAQREHWDTTLPEPVRSVIKVKGHYYAVPVSLVMPSWIWYSTAAFKKAGIEHEPASMDELFSALDKLRAAGLVPLAHGGQAWQENIVFMAVLANVGGRELYLKVLRDRDPRAITSPAFTRVLHTFKRLKSYTDVGSPGRNWNDATAMLISGRAGVQIMGDWVKAEFGAAGQVSGRDFGCIASFGANAPLIIQGDAFVFPVSDDARATRTQQQLAGVMASPATQMAFNLVKGSLPVRTDIDPARFDACSQAAITAMRDTARQVGNSEIYLTPDLNGALMDILTAFWNTAMPVEKAQKSIASVLRD